MSVAQLTLFDSPPTELADVTAPAVVYDEPNRRYNHLLIESDAGAYVFTSQGRVVTFGHSAGPAVDLRAEQLRVLGDYCHRQADRLAGPRNVVATLEDLAALPDLSVVKTGNLLWQIEGGQAFSVTHAMPYTVREVPLPGVVIWTPEAGQ